MTESYGRIRGASVYENVTRILFFKKSQFQSENIVNTSNVYRKKIVHERTSP